MTEVDQAATITRAAAARSPQALSDRARADGLKLLAELSGVPQIEIARRAFDQILFEHRELLLANLDEHFEARADALRRLLGRSLKEIRDTPLQETIAA